LTWQREWGGHIEHLEAMLASGKNVKALESRPILQPGLDLYFYGYQDLLYDRPIGMDVGLIPWSSIIKWCKLNAIYDINDIGTAIKYIRGMEAADREINDKKGSS
jgi:hypothetical protein